MQRSSRTIRRYLLDLEREAFLSLMGTRKTLERIEHMLKTGKPLSMALAPIYRTR